MDNSRRGFIRNSVLLTGTVGLDIHGLLKENHPPDEDANRLVLLGTQGGPLIRSYQQTPSSNLIVYKNTHFLIDAGYGTTFKLKEAGVQLAKLNHIFISHLHSDHYLDLGPLLYNAWISGLSEKINLYAPKGITHVINAYWQSNEYDINTRIKDEGRPDIRKLIVIHNIREGVLSSTSDFEITAMKNIHPPVGHSFAFRFRLGEKLIVFSGDTAYCAALTDFAMGADFLVHEAMYLPAVDEMAKRRPNAIKLIASIKSHHTNAEDVGRIAKSANVKTLILTHFVPPDDKTLTDQVWLDAIKINYQGKTVIGKDMLRFPL